MAPKKNPAEAGFLINYVSSITDSVLLLLIHIFDPFIHDTNRAAKKHMSLLIVGIEYLRNNLLAGATGSIFKRVTAAWSCSAAGRVSIENPIVIH